MNCLYITLFFNTVTGNVPTFIKSWNQLLYPRAIEVRRLPSEPCHDFFLHLIIIVGIQECGEKPMFHLQSQWSTETHLLPVPSAWETLAWNPSVSFCDRLLTFWVPSVHTIFCTLIFSLIVSWIVVLDTSGMWCKSLIATRRFVQISPSVSWRRSSEIKDGLPFLCSSWTSVLHSENSRHHFITFCRFITLP